MIPYESIIVPLTAVLGLSLTVERILEFVKNLLERMLRSQEGRKVPGLSKPAKMITELEKVHQRDSVSRETENKAEAIAQERVKIKNTIRKEPDLKKREDLKKQLVELEKDGEWGERVSNAVILVEPAKQIDNMKAIKTFILQLLGFALGIGLVHYSGIRLFNCFLNPFDIEIMPWLDYLFTGLLIGGGSAPMHILVNFITQRKIPEVEETASEEKTEAPPKPEKATGPAVVSPPSEAGEPLWIDIPYRGGVDREKLREVHLRNENPNMVVYHHTAMNSKSTFEDVVRVIKSRTDSRGNHWLTGYNCVILADGSIHPFCRWDRYGNHAVGYNRRSLGIAFNGNFESDPADPYSNSDGTMGLIRPPEIQLKAGARVIALWTFLYPIDMDFEKSIIPHCDIASKNCPGSEFLYDGLKKWIEYFRNQWEKSEVAQERIEEYKLKPYLFKEA